MQHMSVHVLTGVLTGSVLALQGRHEVLSLRSAMVQFYKLENFATAAIFARRLLEKSQTTAQVLSCTPSPCTRCGNVIRRPTWACGLVCAPGHVPLRSTTWSLCSWTRW